MTDFFIALLLSSIIVIGFCLFTVLFYKGGPYLKQASYERRTLWNFFYCWQVRKVTADVEAMTEERARLAALEAQKSEEFVEKVPQNLSASQEDIE